MAPHILSITGSDGAGGAGIQADIKAATSLGAMVDTVITTITMQNSLGIQEYYDIPAEIVEQQIDAVADDVVPAVMKIGMIRNVYTLSAIVRCIQRYKPQWVLFSPVVSSSKEEQLMSDELILRTREDLVPHCSLVVVRKRDAVHFHVDGEANATKIVEADDSHGQCNELCSAIAVYLTQGCNTEDAVRKAKLAQLPMHVGDDTSTRTVELYRRFLELQSDECLTSHDVNYYADKLNVSARYLAQVTRRVAEQTPKSIIDATLLERIKQLLADPSLTIQEVAYRLEFSSQAHLSNFFKKLTGVSPTEFRRG